MMSEANILRHTTHCGFASLPTGEAEGEKCLKFQYSTWVNRHFTTDFNYATTTYAVSATPPLFNTNFLF